MYSREITVPEGVSIEIDSNKVKISGEKGKLKRVFKLSYEIKLQKDNSKIKVTSESEKRKAKALVGTVAAHIRNMIKGVTKGYTYRMKIVYSHFPMTVKAESNKVLIQNFLGERTSRTAKIVGDSQVEIKEQNVIVTGIDKENVGLTCSNIEQSCRIVGYDRRRFNDGIYLTSKE